MIQSTSNLLFLHKNSSHSYLVQNKRDFYQLERESVDFSYSLRFTNHWQQWIQLRIFFWLKTFEWLQLGRLLCVKFVSYYENPMLLCLPSSFDQNYLSVLHIKPLLQSFIQFYFSQPHFHVLHASFLHFKSQNKKISAVDRKT